MKKAGKEGEGIVICLNGQLVELWVRKYQGGPTPRLMAPHSFSPMESSTDGMGLFEPVRSRVNTRQRVENGACLTSALNLSFFV